MATPPYNLDISDPTDGSLGSAFPANERTFRDNVNSYLNTEHDFNTGFHDFQVLTLSQRTALSSPPNGMLVWTTDTPIVGLYLNTGTSNSPVWASVEIISIGTTATRTAFTNPPTGMLHYTSDATPPGIYINTGTPGSPVWTIGYGAGIGLTATIGPPGTGSITIHATKAKITGVAGGGGGAGTGTGGTAGGAAGSYFVTWLTGLTVGNTITTSVGAGGTGGGALTASGGAGSDTSISSGTQTITTTTAKGGAGGITPTSPGSGQQSTGGVTATILGFANGGGVNIGGINGTYGPYGDGGSISLNGATIPTAFGGGTVASQNGYPGIIVVEWIA